MNKGWYTTKQTIEKKQMRSFLTGVVGGSMIIIFGNTTLKQQAEINTRMMKQQIEQMKLGYEIKSGVPYLLRDEAFIKRMKKNPYYYSSSSQYHWMIQYVQHEWNLGIYQLANLLNKLFG